MNRNRRRRTVIRLSLGLMGIIGLLSYYFLVVQFGKSEGVTSSEVTSPTASATPIPFPSVTPTSTTVPSPTPTATTLPTQVNLAVSFTSQAPFGVWDALHEDACEETSLLIVKHFLDKTTVGSADQVDQEIRTLVQTGENLGQGVSITVNQLTNLAEKQYGLKSGRIKNNPSIKDIKTELAAGNPVIIPAAGKVLANPHYSNGGPVYHMLVIKGYDSTGFITQDPGTKHGENYHYSFDHLYDSIHDWDAQDILQGKKVYVVFE